MVIYRITASAPSPSGFDAKGSKENETMSEAIAIENRDATLGESAEIEEEEKPARQVDWKNIWKPLSIIAGVFVFRPGQTGLCDEGVSDPV